MSPGQELSLGFESIFIKSLSMFQTFWNLLSIALKIRKKSAEAPKGNPALTYPHLLLHHLTSVRSRALKRVEDTKSNLVLWDPLCRTPPQCLPHTGNTGTLTREGER